MYPWKPWIWYCHDKSLQNITPISQCIGWSYYFIPVMQCCVNTPPRNNCDIPNIYCWCFWIIYLLPPVSDDHAQRQGNSPTEYCLQLNQRYYFVLFLLIICCILDSFLICFFYQEIIYQEIFDQLNPIMFYRSYCSYQKRLNLLCNYIIHQGGCHSFNSPWYVKRSTIIWINWMDHESVVTIWVHPDLANLPILI